MTLILSILKFIAVVVLISVALVCRGDFIFGGFGFAKKPTTSLAFRVSVLLVISTLLASCIYYISSGNR